MDEEDDGITFVGQIYKIATTVDGGYRLQLDITHDDREQIKRLIDYQESLFQVAMVPLPDSE